MIRRLRVRDAVEVAQVNEGGLKLRPITGDWIAIIQATFGRSPR